MMTTTADPTDTPFVTIVSGLPRSGTSLMMQMLEAGGMRILADDLRPADAGNPRGYLEYAAVKRTRQDASWVEQAHGKAVKVIHALLEALPAGSAYRVLFMRRDLDEVIASQQSLLKHLDRAGAALPADRLAAALSAQLERARHWLTLQPNVAVLDVEHRELLDHPHVVADRVNRFLDNRLNVKRMTAAVDPALYRQRTGRP